MPGLSPLFFIFVLLVPLISSLDAEEEWKHVQVAVSNAKDDLEEAAKETTNKFEEKVGEIKENFKEKVHETEDAAKGCSKEQQCNNRGTCVGNIGTYICFCELGYSGKNCQDTMCDSARDCNGRGLCLGSTTELTCLCNLGYAGKHCEIKN